MSGSDNATANASGDPGADVLSGKLNTDVTGELGADVSGKLNTDVTGELGADVLDFSFCFSVVIAVSCTGIRRRMSVMPLMCA